MYSVYVHSISYPWLLAADCLISENIHLFSIRQKETNIGDRVRRIMTRYTCVRGVKYLIWNLQILGSNPMFIGIQILYVQSGKLTVLHRNIHLLKKKFTLINVSEKVG